MVNTLTEVAVFVGCTMAFVLLVIGLKHLSAQYEQRFEQTVSLELGRAHVFIDARRLMWGHLLFVLILIAIAGFFGVALWGIFVLMMLSVAVPRLLLRHIKSRRQRSFRQQLPEAISLLASGLRAGSSLASAIREMSRHMPKPMRQELSMIEREQRLGRSMDQALANLERRMPLEETRLAVAAFVWGSRAGSGMADSLEALGETMRRRLLLEGKIRALTAQGKLQAWVMGLLPFVMLGAMIALDGSLATLYFHSIEGVSVLATVVTLQLMGVWMIRRMITIDI